MVHKDFAVPLVKAHAEFISLLIGEVSVAVVEGTSTVIRIVRAKDTSLRRKIGQGANA